MTKLENDIIGILREDARSDARRISVLLGKSESEIENVIAELEKRGVIVKYTALVNEDKLGVERVQALIEVKVSPMKTAGFDSIAEDIYQFAEVKSVYLMSGAYDLAVFIEGKSLKEVAGFVSEKLSVMDKILSTATHFILKKYKVEGIVVEEEEHRRRLVVHP